jgi:cyclohexa-1,5-dienecarbonyl-CoA hydratase
MSFQNLRLEQKEAITHITLNRPPLNVIDIQTLQELRDAFTEARKHSSKVVVLAAEGKAFSAGVDIKDHTSDKVELMMKLLREAFQALWALEQPTLAKVQGMALGGGMEFAMGCDFIIASENAQFGQPEIKVGVFPPIACLLLPRLLPWAKALELVMPGESINAQEAYRLGLINRVVPAAQLESEAAQYVSKLTELSTPVLKLTKRASLLSLDDSSADKRMQTYLILEKLYLQELMPLHDAQEGLKAYMEKRKPTWQDK